jgi:hypothetical protein
MKRPAPDSWTRQLTYMNWWMVWLCWSMFVCVQMDGPHKRTLLEDKMPLVGITTTIVADKILFFVKSSPKWLCYITLHNIQHFPSWTPRRLNYFQEGKHQWVIFKIMLHFLLDASKNLKSSFVKAEPTISMEPLYSSNLTIWTSSNIITLCKVAIYACGLTF